MAILMFADMSDELLVGSGVLHELRRMGKCRVDVWLQLATGETALLELKALHEMTLEHRRQLEYYMHHSGVHHGYLIDFPHDKGLESVDDQSHFDKSVLCELSKRVEDLLENSPALRLHNAFRPVKIMELTRRPSNNKWSNGGSSGNYPCPRDMVSRPMVKAASCV